MTFFLTSVFMLMVFWRPQEWLFPALFGVPLLQMLVAVTLLSLFVEVGENRIRIIKVPQHYLLLGLWLSAPLSHIAHTYFAGMLMSIEPVFKICFFCYLLFLVLDRPARLQQTGLLFVALGCFMAVHGLLQTYRGYGFAGQVPYLIDIAGYDIYTRSCYFGIFQDPNDMAQFMILGVPFSFLVFRRSRLGSFIVGCAISALLIWGLATTHSRGGQLGLIAVLGMQVVLWFPHKWFPYLVALGLLGALALCPFAGPALDQSAIDRVIYWGLANQLFVRSPIFGVGYEMYWIVTTRGEALHNAFVTCYLELGVVGYWFWFGLIQLGVVGCWRVRGALKKVRDPEARFLRFFAGQGICAMAGFCASGYFLSRTFIFPLFFLMAMLGVVPVIARRYLPVGESPELITKRDVRRGITIGTVLSLIYIYLSCILLNMGIYG